MNPTPYCTSRPQSWWERLLAALAPQRPRPELPDDSLFAEAGSGAIASVADVPEAVKAQIREEAVLEAFHRLGPSLRLLLHATTPGKEPGTRDAYQQIVNVWRYELEHRVNLVPDTYCGAIQRYRYEMEEAYVIDGRCRPGDLLRIRVPCWRLRDRVVVRGEAERIEAPDAPEENP